MGCDQWRLWSRSSAALGTVTHNLSMRMWAHHLHCVGGISGSGSPQTHLPPAYPVPACQPFPSLSLQPQQLLLWPPPDALDLAPCLLHFWRPFLGGDTAAGSSKRTEGFSKMEETIENLTQWWECGYICGAQQAGITGVVLLTIFLNKNSFIKTKIFCNEVLHFYHNHHYHFPQLESFHVMKTSIIDF